MCHIISVSIIRMSFSRDRVDPRWFYSDRGRHSACLSIWRKGERIDKSSRQPQFTWRHPSQNQAILGEKSIWEGLTNDNLELLDYVANQGRVEGCGGKVDKSEESGLLLGERLGNPLCRVQCPWTRSSWGLYLCCCCCEKRPIYVEWWKLLSQTLLSNVYSIANIVSLARTELSAM